VILALAVLVPLLIHPSAGEPGVLKRVVLEVGARLLVLLFILQTLWNRRLEVAPSPITPAAAALLCSGLVSAILSRYRYAAWEALAFQTYLVVVYLAAIWIFRTPRQLTRLLFWSAASACLVSIYGIVQSFGADFVRYRELADRVFASQGNATYLAGYLILLLPMLINLASGLPWGKGTKTVRPPVVKLFVIAASGLCVWCLYLTYSRAAAVGLMAALALNYLLLAERKEVPLRSRVLRTLAPLAALAIISLAMWTALSPAEKGRLLNTFNLEDYWAKRRISLWTAGLHTFMGHMAVGTGPGTYQIYSRSLPWDMMAHAEWRQFPGTFHAHNEFIETASDQGIVGLVCLTWLLAAFFFSSVRALARVSDPIGRRLISGAIGGVTAFLFQNLFGVTMRFIGASLFFWLMLAIPTVVERAYSAEGRVERGMSFPRLAQAWRWVITAALVFAWFAGLPGSMKPVEAQVRLVRARGLIEHKAWTKAARELELALAAQPNSPQLHEAMGEVYASIGTMDRVRDALREFQAAAKLNPDYRQVQYNIGVAYSKLGKHKQALKAYIRAAALQNAPWQYAAMAESYRALNRMDEARWAARKAASLEPGNLEYRRRLEALGGQPIGPSAPDGP
jgi:O-antigen ligase